MLPTLFANTARAVTAAPDDRVLVVIQLDGGNDGLNTVVPYADDGYGRARNKLRLETDKLHKLSDHVALHPNMRAAKELFDDGRLSIVGGVGYPNPDRSHFRSMAIWQTAKFDDAQHRGYGWLGSALDQRVLKQNVGAGSKCHLCWRARNARGLVGPPVVGNGAVQGRGPQTLAGSAARSAATLPAGNESSLRAIRFFAGPLRLCGSR